MNIAVFRKFLITFCITLLFYFTFDAVAVSQHLNISPTKKNNHPKMSSHLRKLEKEYEQGTGIPQMVAQGMDAISQDPNLVTVYLMPEPDSSIDEDALDDIGVQIIKHADNVIKAKVRVNMLTAIADTVNGISHMRTPDKLLPVAIESEGVILSGAVDYHNTGYDGSGVRIAVIDVGFLGLSDAILSNELPDNVVKVDCTVQPCNSSNPSIEDVSSHGTAVAEIVHDMAPGALLNLIKVSDTMDLEDAKEYSVANGIRIINHSLVVPNTNFYDGECWSLGELKNPVCSADDAYAKNILWVNAAGNEAQRHYEARFSDPDADGWHNVSVNSETISISANDGDTIEVYLTWDAWNETLTTNENYDLYLYDSSGNEVDRSVDSQPPFPPSEIIIYAVPSAGTYNLKVKKENATSDHALEIYSIHHNLNPAVTVSSLLSPADAAGAMAVGAINYNNWATGPQATYSSQGPTNDGRPKPDIMGPDRVSTYVRGLFGGTSASTPHVAGAAALILQRFPSFSVIDLRKFLFDTAIDMGDQVPNNIFGYGSLNLDINTSITTSITVISEGGGGGGCFIATAAYGSYAAPSVQILREMRNRFLLKSRTGISLVNFYYKHSPPLADFIAKHDNVKILVRLGLLPLVGISWLTLKLGFIFTISLMIIFIFGLKRFLSRNIFSKKNTI